MLSSSAVAADRRKVQAVLDWPVPKNLKALRCFLGLTGYYRKFIRGYSTLAAPLTSLNKKNAFMWRPAAQQAFERKEALTSPPILALANFSLPFVVECDASATRIGDILMQNNHPIAYISQEVQNPERVASAYEREMMAILFAVKKWRQYLLGERVYH